MHAPHPPDYAGHGLVNLVAELEFRLSGDHRSPILDTALSAAIPDRRTVVFVLFDGLGADQLDHPAAAELASSLIGTVDAPFPSTTTVSLATIATGVPPSQHGLLAYKLWLPQVDEVVNTIHMTNRSGAPVDIDLGAFLPSPNLWERLRANDIEPIVVQPGNFASTPLTKVLYRGARFEGYWNLDEAVNVTVDVASVENRFVLLYIPHVDFAAHMAGQQSADYTQAMREANGLWARLCERLPETVALVGTADHGHVDIAEDSRAVIGAEDLTEGFVSEDGRVLFVHGEGAALASRHGGLAVGASSDGWWGPGPNHPAFDDRAPRDIVFLPNDAAVFDQRSNHRLTGYHGSLEPAERLVPVLVR